jgi:hypothetical protein
MRARRTLTKASCKVYKPTFLTDSSSAKRVRESLLEGGRAAPGQHALRASSTPYEDDVR